MTKLVKVGVSEDSMLDVVFVHGLDGDARKSWSAGPKRSFWPEWLALDVSGVAVWSLGYDAASSRWLGHAMPIQDRAINLLAELENHEIGRRPLCFVTHSMGGLVVKEMLLHAADGRAGYGEFATATRGVVFLATPHTGSDVVTKAVVKALGVAYRKTPAVVALERNGAHLRQLNIRYRNWATDHKVAIGHRIFYETQPTRGVHVVDAGSADPGIPGQAPIPVDANHIDICKPTDRSDLVYGQIKRFITSIRDTLIGQAQGASKTSSESGQWQQRRTNHEPLLTLESRSQAEPVRVGVVPLLADRFQARGIVLDLAQADPDAARTTVLVGTGGVGKTQLAAEFAATAWHDEGLRLAVWASADSRLSIISAYAEAAHRLLGADSTDSDAAAQLLLEWMGSTNERWLIVLDDLLKPSDLRELWPRTGRAGQVVVTTRRRDPALRRTDRLVVPVDVFTPTQSVSYLQAKLIATGTGPDLDEGAADLADTLGHLPLALAQAAAYQLDRGLTCHRYRDRFLDRSRTLAEVLPDPDEDELPDGYRHTIATTWSLSIDLADRLAPNGLATPLMHVAALLDPAGTPLTVFLSDRILDHLASTTGQDVNEETVTDALAVLHRLSLVTLDHNHPTRVVVAIHALVQRVVRNPLTPDVLRHLARTTADALLTCHPSHPDTVRSLARLLGAELKVLLDSSRPPETRVSSDPDELPEHIDPDTISLDGEHAEHLAELLSAAVDLQGSRTDEHGPDDPRAIVATLALGYALAAARQFKGQEDIALALIADAREGLMDAYTAGTVPLEILGQAESIHQWVLDLTGKTSPQ